MEGWGRAKEWERKRERKEQGARRRPAELLSCQSLYTEPHLASMARWSAAPYTFKHPRGLREMSFSSGYENLQLRQKPKYDKWWAGKRGLADSQHMPEQGEDGNVLQQASSEFSPFTRR